jgi:Regulator of chromosome condensation (RCC1) repeat/Kelch motif
MNRKKEIFTSVVAMMTAVVAFAPLSVGAVGTWTRLARQAPDAVELMLLMPDGTVMAASQGGSSSGQGWFKLTPDSHGSYINGTWTTLASMHYTRLYYASDVLKDGRVFVAGAEYGSGTNSAEVYDPKNNTWTVVGPVPAGQRTFLDNISKMLPNGDILIAPVGPATPGGTVIFHPASNNFTAGPRLFRGSYQDEASWVKLPDDSILTIDPFGTHSERYIPSLNKWIDDAVLPISLYNNIGEMGPGFLLPNGKAFFIGGTPQTAIYTPSGSTNMGSWAAGPDIPNGHGVSDGSGAMMVNGKVLCAVGSSTNFDAPTWFYEYDYLSNSFTAVNGPNGPTENISPYITAMLDLPDGTVLMSRFSRQIYVYQPDGFPLAFGKPTITSITQNTNSYHLTGTGLNGISEGACYGDDIQMDSNYPLVRLRDAAGNVYYARTFDWSTSSVMTSNRPVTTEFSISTNVPAGVYSLVVVANGISSDPVPFFVGSLVITSQPQGETVLPGQAASFTVAAAGDVPIAYQWRKDGVIIPGATTSTYSIAAAQLTDAGGYSAFVTNVTGAVTSSVAALVVIPTVPLPFALNNSNFVWGNMASPVWYGQTNISHDGVASAQTFLMTNGQQAALVTTITGPGTLSFWCKVSSQADSDFLSFSVNGTNQFVLSGEVDWQQHSFYLPAGQLNLIWAYTKDAGGSAGQDAAWIDQVSFVVGGTAPYITVQPADQNSSGTPVTFSVSADGTPDLAYQWRLNQSPLAGATASSFTIVAPLPRDNGAYSVLITNPYGSIVSSNALLAVVPIIAVGDNSVGQLNVPGSTTNAVAIAAGSWHNLALKADGKVVAWGNNNNGQCDVPANLSGVVALAAGGYHCLALKANGSVAGWGENFDGQASPPAQLSNVVAIAAGTWHSLALLADGTVQGWGDDSSGQTDIPPDLGDVIAIAAGGNHSLALRADGTVVAWGENINSQGFFVGQSVVPAAVGKTATISAGDYHSLAIKLNGAAAGWGDNSLGQTDVPDGLGVVTALAGGGGHTVALKANGSPSAWGNNFSGQCNIPTAISNVISVAAGSAHSLLLLGSRPGNPVIMSAVHSAGQFSVNIQSFTGKSYSLEYKDSLGASTWTALPAVQGNGTLQVLTDANATVAQRFYRVRQF